MITAAMTLFEYGGNSFDLNGWGVFFGLLFAAAASSSITVNK